MKLGRILGWSIILFLVAAPLGVTALTGTSMPLASIPSGTLAYLAWDEPLAVTDLKVSEKDLAVDGNNTVHAVWLVTETFSRDIYYAFKPQGGTWSQPERIYTSPQEIGPPCIAVDQTGRVHALWGREFAYMDVQFVYMTKDPDDTWTAQPLISFPSGSITPFNTVLDLIPQGNVLHLLYIGSVNCSVDEVFYTSKTGGGNWSTPVVISNTGRRVTDLAAVVDNQGTMHLVFNVIGGAYVYHALAYATHPAGGAWTAPAEIRARMQLYYSAPSMAVDQANTLHLVFGDTVSASVQGTGRPASAYGAVHMQKPQGGAWSATDVLPFSTVPYCTDFDPAVAVDGQNVLYAVYPEAGGLAYTGKAPGGAWSALAPVTNLESWRPAMLAGPNGNLHLMWTAPDGLWYALGESSAAPPEPPPTPTNTPEPVSAEIPPEGGKLTHQYPGHTTTLHVPPGAMAASSVFTISYSLPPTNTGDFLGIDHFFEMDGEQTTFSIPVTVSVGYSATILGSAIPGTLALYTWQDGTWITDSITLTNRTESGLTCQIQHFSLFGVLGETYRVYLPLLLRR